MQIEQAATVDGPRAALQALRAAPPRAFDPPLFVDLRRAQEVRALTATGRADAARRLLDARPAMRGALLVDLALATGDGPAARQALDTWVPADDPRGTIELLLRRAAVLAAEGSTTTAAATWQEALEVAEAEELRRPFLEQPAAMRFLRSEGARGSQSFARSIVEASSTTRCRAAAQAALVDPLTERELEVLDYLPTRLSNTEMAAALFVSVNTLKSHLRHIYTKLAATDRNDAVAKAGDLSLL
jgi:LuxR family maltose regulon positive regulatory protein